jgi:hypothetical protein
MKRVLSIVVLCVVLFTLSGLTAFAGTPDVTPPVVYAVGVSPTTDPMKGCTGNVPVKVQAKATDLGGVEMLQATLKAPDGSIAGTWNMALAADGYWKVWIPKTAFAVQSGMWYVRVKAWDYFKNATTSGWKAITVTACDKTAPTISDLTWTPNEIVPSDCDGIKSVLVQANVWDASGIKKVELWYQAPTATGWAVVNMAHYSNLGYQASIGNFPAGILTFYVKAFDPFNHVTYTAQQAVAVACP